MDYDYIDGQWRGIDQVGSTDYFNEPGEKVDFQ
jgi:hypothetical protein